MLIESREHASLLKKIIRYPLGKSHDLLFFTLNHKQLNVRYNQDVRNEIQVK